MRMPGNPDRFVVKGRQYEIDALSEMRPENMVVCDTDGFLIEGLDGAMQCLEVKIHSCIYQARPDGRPVGGTRPSEIYGVNERFGTATGADVR